MQTRLHARSRRAWFPALLTTAALSLVGVNGVTIRAAIAAPGDAEMAAALKHFDEGRQAFEKGAFEQALVAFQASYAASPSPNSRLFVARCYRALGKMAKAYTTFQLASREAQDRLNATGEKRYGATRDAASSEAAELESKIAHLTLAVPGGVPDGFVLKEDGEDVPKEAWGVAVETDPGTLTIEATGPRLVPFRKLVTLAAGAKERVDVEAKKLPTATLSVALKTRPSGLSIALDGSPLDPATVDKVREVDVGEHVLTVEAPGYLPFQWKQPLADGEKKAVDVTLSVDARATGSKGTPRWLFFVTAGIGVAGLGAATGIAVDAQSLHNSQTALNPVQRSPSTQTTISSLSTVANVLFVTGGVFAVGAGVLAFTTKWRSDAPPQQTSLAPWLAPGAGGVALTGQF